MALRLLSSTIIVGLAPLLCLLTYCKANGIDQIPHVLESVKELSKNVEDLKSSLVFTRKDLKAQIQSASEKLRTNLEERLDRVESMFDKTRTAKEDTEGTTACNHISPEVTSTFLETENDIEEAERRMTGTSNSTCGGGGLTTEWKSYFDGVTSFLNSTLSDFETGKDAMMHKMSSIESTVSATLVTLLDHWKNWTDVHYETTSCREGWKYYEKSCYFFSFTEGNWSHGRQECLGMDSDYVKVTSTGEWNFVASHITSNSWVGLTDQEEEGTLKWISDSTVEDTRHQSWWHRNQPDNRNNEDCVHYWFHYQKNLWNDAHCTDKMRYICEKTLWDPSA